MSTTRTWFERAEKHLELLEQCRKTEHEVAVRFEQLLAEAVMVFSLLDRVSQLRRENIYRGLEEPNPEIDASEKELFGRWLAVAPKAIRKLEPLEECVPAVEGADKLLTCLENARSFFETWTPAIQAMALGSRVVEFSDEDADQIHALLDSPPGSPGHLTRPTRSVPVYPKPN